MIFGYGVLFDVVVIMVLCWVVAMLLLPLASWIEWKILVKKHGKEQAWELLRRWR